MKPTWSVNGQCRVPACYSFGGMNPPVAPVPEPQSAGAVLMVRPARFAFNPQTAASNAFQSAPGGTNEAAGGGGRMADAAGGAAPAREGPDADAAARSAALREFDGLAQALHGAGVEVLVAEDTPSPVKPDAVFPNNWVSFHHDGTVVLYPMLAPNRRLERRDDLLMRVARDGAYR